jgi:hypothetical protein
MSSSQRLAEIELQIYSLPRVEQLRLIERMAQQLRQSDPSVDLVDEGDLALMASDPEIQKEIKAINDEFSPTESDGLEPIIGSYVRP